MSEIEALEVVKTWADEKQGRIEYEGGYWAIYQFDEGEDDFLFLYENTDIRDLVKYLQDK